MLYLLSKLSGSILKHDPVLLIHARPLRLESYHLAREIDLLLNCFKDQMIFDLRR